MEKALQTLVAAPALATSAARALILYVRLIPSRPERILVPAVIDGWDLTLK